MADVDLVLVPYADWRQPIGAAAGGLAVEVYDGTAPPPQEVLDRVTLYVRPYLVGQDSLALMARMPRLRAVQALSAGVDDVWSWLPDGVTLHNAAGVHDASTAELAVALVLASLRGIDDFARQQQSGRWRSGVRPSLADRRVLVVGYGQIGRAVEDRLAPFEVEVVRVARSARTSDDGRAVHGTEELPGLLPSADVVILVTPLTDQSRGMVDAAFLSRMKDGSLLVNVGRGPVVVTADLLVELQSGRLRAALDVTDPEPLPPDHPLWHAPGLLVSPHVGGNTTAFLPRAQRLVADQVRRWAADEPLANRMAR